MDKLLTVIGLVICLGLVFYLDSSTANVTNEFRSSILYTPDEIEAVSLVEEETDADSDPTESIIPIYEYLLEKQENVGGYVVETYREYEIYQDEKGNTVKKVPTSHLDFIRYKR